MTAHGARGTALSLLKGSYRRRCWRARKSIAGASSMAPCTCSKTSARGCISRCSRAARRRAHHGAARQPLAQRGKRVLHQLPDLPPATSASIPRRSTPSTCPNSSARRRPELAAILAELDTANHFAVTHFFNIGFCLLAGWSAPRLGWGAWWEHDALPEYMHQLEQLAARLHALLPHVTRQAGLSRCRLLLDRRPRLAHSLRCHRASPRHARTHQRARPRPPPRTAARRVRPPRPRRAATGTRLRRAGAEIPDCGAEGTLVAMSMSCTAPCARSCSFITAQPMARRR